jgi:hypothetical protein
MEFWTMDSTLDEVREWIAEELDLDYSEVSPDAKLGVLMEATDEEYLAFIASFEEAFRAQLLDLGPVHELPARSVRTLADYVTVRRTMDWD